MNSDLLDPWTDAAAIAARLMLPSAHLVILIGAESWCERCRTLKPAFESMAQQKNIEGEVWLWLDLEEHADFLDEFIPDDLPLLMSYRGPSLTQVLLGRAVNVAVLAEKPPRAPMSTELALPDIRNRLMAGDWAV